MRAFFSSRFWNRLKEGRSGQRSALFQPACGLQRAGDQQLLDVAGAFVDLADAHVAVDALDRKVGHVAVAAVDLDRVRADALGHLGGEQLGHRRLFQTRQSGILHRGRVLDQLARRFDLRGHVGQAELHGLVLEDGLAKAFAFARIVQRRLVRGARHADRLRGDADASAFKAGQRDLVALPFLADQILGRDAAVVEQALRGVRRMLAHLLFQAGDDVAGRGRRHPERADALLPAALSVTAMTMATSAYLPLVMNCLVPLMTYSPPSRVAVVRSAAASLPVCGSVRQKAPSISPCASGRSHCSFWRSLAYIIAMLHTGQLLTEMMVEVPPSPAAISSSTSASDT